MSFKNQSHPDDERKAPDVLPPELAALGEKLQADALRLGKTYPSCQPPMALLATLEQRSRRQWYLRSWVIAVSSGAAVLFFAVTLYALRSLETNTYPTKPAVVRAADPVTIDIAASPSLPLQPVSFRPALADVNGPELEGLLDLMHEQPQSAAVISF